MATYPSRSKRRRRQVQQYPMPGHPAVQRVYRNKQGIPEPKPRRRQSSSRIIAIGVLVGFGAVFVFGILALFGVYAYYQLSGRIVPGVMAGKTDLGGMTFEQAATDLQVSWNLQNQIQVHNGIESVSVSPSDLGMGIDPIITAQRAHAVAHGDFFLAEIMQMLVSATDGWQVHPEFYYDETVAMGTLQQLAPELSLPPKDASLQVVGEQVVAVPGEIGYTINMEESLATLNANPESVLISGLLQVTLKPVIPPVMDAAEAATEAQKLIDTPVTIQAYDAIVNESIQLPVPRSEVATWLTVEASETGPRASLDPVKVGAYLNSLAPDLGSGRFLDGNRYSHELVDSIVNGGAPVMMISHHPTTYTVQPGDTLLKIGWNLGIPFWMILEANPGLNPDALPAGGAIQIPSKDDLLPLPVIPGKRIVIGIRKQHMWIYQDGSQIRDFVISTGIDRSPTQPGVFQIQTHKKNAYASVWDLYMPHFLGVYEAWPGFMNGIHGLPTLSSGQRLWANILGSPASYGCIILDLKPAEWLYNWAEEGVVVEIVE